MTKEKDSLAHCVHKCAIGIVGSLDELDANRSGHRHCTLPLRIADCPQIAPKAIAAKPIRITVPQD